MGYYIGCLCETKYQGPRGVSHHFGRVLTFLKKISRDMGHRSDGWAISHDLGPLSSKQQGTMNECKFCYLLCGKLWDRTASSWVICFGVFRKLSLWTLRCAIQRAKNSRPALPCRFSGILACILRLDDKGLWQQAHTQRISAPLESLEPSCIAGTPRLKCHFGTYMSKERSLSVTKSSPPRVH